MATDAHARSSRPPRTSRSGSRRSSGSSTRRRCSLAQRFEELREAAAEDERAGRVGRRRADRVRDRDPLRQGRELRRRARPPARRPRRGCSRSPPTTASLLAATGTHPWSPWQEQRIIDTDHYRRVEEGLKYVAWRNNTFSLHVHVGVRGADRAVAVCDALRPVLPELLAHLGQLAVPRRARLAACTRRARRSSRRASRAAGSRTPSASWRRLRRLRRLPGAHELDRRAHAALVERAPAPHLRDRRGADLRRPVERRGVDRAGRAGHRLRGPGRRSTTTRASARAAAGPADRGELLARDPLRARRQADRPRARRGVPGRGGGRPAAGVDRARPGGARHRRRRCRRRTAPSASAARWRRARRWRRSSRRRWRRPSGPMPAEEVRTSERRADASPPRRSCVQRSRSRCSASASRTWCSRRSSPW